MFEREALYSRLFSFSMDFFNPAEKSGKGRREIPDCPRGLDGGKPPARSPT